MPTYARPTQLAGCLRALSKLDYPLDRCEVIVVDDGSEQPTRSRIEAVCAEAEVRLVRQLHAGPAAARNVGADHARGEYVVFLDQDCEPAADWLTRLASRFRDTSNAAVGGKTVNALPGNLCSATTQLLADYMHHAGHDEHGQPRFLASNNFAVPLAAFRSIGRFDVAFRVAGSEDRDFCDRWHDRGYPLLHAPDAVVYHSHALTFRSLLRKHFDYGGGAFHYRRARAARRADRVRVEPLRFYIELVVSPFRQTSLVRAMLLSALLVMTQVANAVGFFFEAARGRPRRDFPA